jgi:hypothetical protein
MTMSTSLESGLTRLYPPTTVLMHSLRMGANSYMTRRCISSTSLRGVPSRDGHTGACDSQLAEVVSQLERDIDTHARSR